MPTIQNINQQVNNSSQSLATITSTASFKEALNEFYEIHQRSQITGVSTVAYNMALEKLGVNPNSTQSALEGIHLLEENGYTTGRPSDEAIIKYGTVDEQYGNKSYMKNGVNESSETLKEEIKTLNESNDNAFKGAQNYYDIAVKRTESAPSALTIPSASINTNETLKHTLDNEIIAMLKSDKNLLRDLLKEFL